LRRDLEKELLLQLARVQVKKDDKVSLHLQKTVVKILTQISSPALAFKLPKVPLSVHIWSSLNGGEVGLVQEDVISGGLLKPIEKPCLTIDLITKLMSSSELSVYQILYYSVMESRRRIDEYLLFLSSSCNVVNKSETILETLVKNNAYIAKSIKQYTYEQTNKQLIKTQALENISPNEEWRMTRGEKLLKVLEAELKDQSNDPQANKVTLSMILNEQDNTKEPSQVLLESYIKSKKQIKDYMDKLEEGYKEIEGIKHVRRCFLLHCIISIQRAFKRHHKAKVNKHAHKIQRAFRLWTIKRKHNRTVLNKVQTLIASYKITRWFKLIRKKHIIKLKYPKELTIIENRIKSLYAKNVLQVVKCQSVVRRYIAMHTILPFIKLRKQFTIKRNMQRERSLFININANLIHINREQVNMKLAMEEEMECESRYVQEQRASFEATWQNYIKVIEKESTKQTARHMKDWISQRNKYGKLYWMNTKTGAQQNAHPGKTWLNNIKEKNYIQALEGFERAMMPIIVSVNDYKAKYHDIKKLLINKKAEIIEEVINVLN
jgi:hypothetical protein